MLFELLDISIVCLPLVKLHVGVHLPQCLSECRVKVILDVVISPTRKFSRDVSPLVAQLCLNAEEYLFFPQCPLAIVVDTGLELVVPPEWGVDYL